MASTAEAGGRRRRGLEDNSREKKQKDKANQESKEAKRAVSREARKDVFFDWKQNSNEIIVKLRPGEGVVKVEDVDAAFTDTACQVRFPDGRQWSCNFFAEIESSCSKVQYKEKGNVLQLVLQKKIPFNAWPSMMDKKNKDPVILQTENGKEGSLKVEKVEEEESAPVPSEPKEQKRPKDRGMKRAIKTKPSQVCEPGSKGSGTTKTAGKNIEAQAEPSAKRIIRTKDSKDPERDTPAKVLGNDKNESAPEAGNSAHCNGRSKYKRSGKESLVEKTAECKPAEAEMMEEKVLRAASQDPSSTLGSRNGESEMKEQLVGDVEPDMCRNDRGDSESEVGKGTPEVQEAETVHLDAGEQSMPSKDSISTMEGESEKVDESKEDALEEQPEILEPMVNLTFVKNDSYEKGNDLVVVSVYLKGICKETVKVLFREQDFTIIFQTSDQNFLRFHSSCGPNTVFKWQVKLRNLIHPEQCAYSFTPSRLDITLKKRHSQRWGGLEAPATQGHPKHTGLILTLAGEVGLELQKSSRAEGPRTKTSSSCAVGGAKVALSTGPASLEKTQPGSSQHTLPSKEEPRSAEKEKSRTEDGVPIKQEPLVTSPKPTCMVPPMSHSPVGSEHLEEVEEKVVCLPGFTGLVNLGNTCFMNSVIQSLSNTRELRDYFHDRAFETELNCSNPLGTGGRLAIGFAVLLRSLWKGTHHAFQPSKLKAIVASKASQFTGYAQHDAQEFMAFLLDGLHEDLNRIQNKPYTETVDSDGRQDEVVAEEAWQRHKMRNDSFIVDLFQGQYKSKLVCPVCSKVSITFDPFLYLPVPLPQKQKVLTVFYFGKEPHKKPIKFLMSVSKENSSTTEVLESISKSVRVKLENLRLTEVINSRFHRAFLPSHSLDAVSPSDTLFCFEVLSKDLAKEKVLILQVQQRPQVPCISISKCAACQKHPQAEDEKVKRCTRCYRVGYCNTACQRTHWPNHKNHCKPHVENIGRPFLISVPESRLTYSRLAQLLEGYSRYSLNVFQPPIQSGKLSPELSQCRADLPPQVPEIPDGCCREGCLDQTKEHEKVMQSPEPDICQAAGDSKRDNNSTLTVDSGYSSQSRESQEQAGCQKETSCEKAVKPEAAVPGYQKPTESLASGASQFYIAVIDSAKNEEKLEDKGDAVLDIPEDSSLVLVWKNNERSKEYVLIESKELEYVEDPGSASEAARAGHFTLEHCLNLFTRPEVLAPEEAWYCPKCKQHREASKQLMLWRLPNVLIIQLKRFSFRSFIWRDKINDMVDFPVRSLDLSNFCNDQKDDTQPPIYDLYGVINHYGGMIGGHYTAYARLPSDKNSQRSDVGWRLFDDSTVTTVEESQVVTRYAYVLFYRRRNSPLERPSRCPPPHSAESPAMAEAGASQASLIWQELEEEEEGEEGAQAQRGRIGQLRSRATRDSAALNGLSDYLDEDYVRYFVLGTFAAVVALVINVFYPLISQGHWS
ncbi:ubiquitin carboxyl-terminal hydrolase 19-like isoform X3 [Acipenser ruthenus]|uniref:ubiquitin carboxyl-terminal hydrolase 19-like isoform X3 n=1 Tax=Acipenser ruthenus TaxID=7906 RepID=UPI0027423722|nr:ubiquitin carboxyl-terminal hydrolase 19-like isoform X3 [Acipenser ruthenus]